MNNLKNIRKAKGYTVKQLSELSGLPIRTIEDWEHERRQIVYYHRIKLLADVLECGMGELMTKEEKCVYDGHKSVMALSQKEDGVHINVYDLDGDCEILFETIIPREKALELLQYMKDHEEVKEYLAELTHK